MQVKLIFTYILGYSRKNPNRGGWGYTFLKTPRGIFHIFTLPQEIPDKTKHNSWIFHKIMLEALKIPRPKTKTPGTSTLYLWYPREFHILNPPCLDFSGIAHCAWDYQAVKQIIFWHSSAAFYSENRLSKLLWFFYMNTAILTIFLNFCKTNLGKAFVNSSKKTKSLPLKFVFYLH